MAVTYNIKGTMHPSFTVGKRGITLYYSQTAPEAGDGANGDIFLIPTGLYQKTSGTWNKVQETPATVASKSAAYTTTVSDNIILLNSTGGAFTITLGASTNTSGRRIVLKDSGGAAATNKITVTPASGTVDGQASYYIEANYQSSELVSDGTNWFVINESKKYDLGSIA